MMVRHDESVVGQDKAGSGDSGCCLTAVIVIVDLCGDADCRVYIGRIDLCSRVLFAGVDITRVEQGIVALSLKDSGGFFRTVFGNDRLAGILAGGFFRGAYSVRLHFLCPVHTTGDGSAYTESCTEDAERDCRCGDALFPVRCSGGSAGRMVSLRITGRSGSCSLLCGKFCVFLRLLFRGFFLLFQRFCIRLAGIS